MCSKKEIILDGLSANQRTAAEKNGCDILVRAGAGSGKTKTLVARYLLLLDENRTWHPSDITAVTFTRKAAREMQSRIRREMMKLAWLSENSPEEKQFWLVRLNEMDSANIGTIHSLCSRILRAHPAEAGLDPAFSVLDDNNAAMARSRIIEDVISQISADPDFEKLLNFYDGSRLTRILTDMLKERCKTDAAVSDPPMKTEVYLKKQVEFFLFNSEYSEYMEEYREISESPDFAKKTAAFGNHLLELISGYNSACSAFRGGAHPADCISLFHDPFTGWMLKGRKDGYDVNAKKIREDLRAVFPFLEKDDKNRNIAWYKEFWEQYDAAEECLRKLWPRVRGKYMEFLDSARAIDFDAMESLTLDLLRNHPDIRQTWKDQVKSLLVDEFQDTNDAQTELLSLLNPSHDRLFAVGDKKQSIYGFRGTNVALFDRRGEETERYNGQNILLDITYRTIPELLAPMGSLLSCVMWDDELSAKDYYAAYEPMRTPEKSPEGKDALPGRPPEIEILLGTVQDKEDDPNHEITGRVLALRLTELMEQGLLHSWNDAAILCRNSKDFKQFETALEAWHIPYVTVAGQGYYDRPEIRDILNILRAAENPDDNAVFTGFLMSPSIGFSAEMAAYLYRFACKGGLKMSFRQAFSREDFCFEDKEKQEILLRARSVLNELIRITGQVPLDEVLEDAYRLTGIRTMLAFDTGDRAWLNLDKLLLTARESGLTSVSEFLNYLEDIQETGAREGEAPSDDNGAVRIMTIHQAKGLEFPVTIIAENYSASHSPQFTTDSSGSAVFISSPANPRYAEAKKNADMRDKAEWLRLFYVAATRAEYRLILCGEKPDQGGKKDSWLKRAVRNFPAEWFEDGEHIGPAWGDNQQQTVRVYCSSQLPEKPAVPEKSFGLAGTVDGDCSLLLPLPAKEADPRTPEHTVALTVGKLVHKGMELWRFPDGKLTDPVLADAFRKILLLNGSLNSDEQRSIQEKAFALLSRFKDSDVFQFVASAVERWHEIPFSFPAGNFTVNGVIDLLLRDKTGRYTVIDFKTDELESPDDLTTAIDEHSKQLDKYRKALQKTLGEDPVCKICFLDYCGKVELVAVGKDETIAADEDFVPYEWIWEDESADDYLFDENESLLPDLDSENF